MPDSIESPMQSLSYRTVFFVRDAPRALEFYTEQLGFTVDWVHEEQGRPYVVQVSLLGGQIILNQRESAEDERSGAGRIFFGIDEAQSTALMDHVRRHAIPVAHTRWGGPTLVISDLDGNELFFWLPESEHPTWRTLGWNVA
jgi:catechol 2,3-dioxygenase-like lactoylglutathione lyase family enzyme